MLLPVFAILLGAQAQSLEATHWTGTWTSPSGFQYLAEMQVERGSRDSLQARFRWTLLRSPRAEEQPKLGRVATEFARGRYDAATQLLTLEGYGKDDPDSIIGVDVYRLLVASGGNALVGVTDSHGTWDGRFSARRVSSVGIASGPVRGTYDLYTLANPAGPRQTWMSVTTLSGDSIRVSGPGDGGWEGIGRNRGVEGYYEWRFNDGKTGRTTFVVNSDGTLRGHVLGSGIDWWYLAVPAASESRK